MEEEVDDFKNENRVDSLVIGPTQIQTMRK
jgi:hypothetical protein